MELETLDVPKKKNNSAIRKSSRKPPAVRNEIVARRIAGQTKSQISRDLGVSINTVSSIIELSDVDKLMQDGRLGAMQRVPEALKTLDVRLEKNSESAALWLLDKCFENQQPTGKHLAGDLTLNQTLNVLLHSEGENPQNLNSPVIKQIESREKDK